MQPDRLRIERGSSVIAAAGGEDATMRESIHSNEAMEEPMTETARRTFLKGTAATGTAIAGLTLFGGSAAAQDSEEAITIDDFEDAKVDIQNGNGSFTPETLTITEFGVSEDGDSLVASGTITGEGTRGQGNGNNTQAVDTTFTDALLDLSPAGDSGVCDVLDLNLGPLDLDVLGLVVNLSEVELNIDAVPGPGNLLGNLLCAVANLLN